MGVILTRLFEGFWLNVQLFGLTLIFALPLGLIIAFGSMNQWAPLRFLARRENPGKIVAWLAGLCPISALVKTFVWIIRGTPLMLQLLIIFLGPGLLDWGSPWPSGSAGRLTAATVAFVINYACYFSEIYRGGIQSVPKGQYEAGEVLGMTKSQIFFKVTLLQVVKRILPPTGNEVITLVKDTSLARIISCKEIIMMSNEYTSKGLIWPLFSTALFFLVFVGALTIFFGWLERKLDYFR